MKLLCIDHYNNKHIALSADTDAQYKAWDFLIYTTKNEEDKKSIAKYLWIPADNNTEREWNISDVLSGKLLEDFDRMNKEALTKFVLFKKKFKASFQWAIPVTARYHIFAKQYYFFFYWEERYNFSQFVKDFRQEINHNFFLFQVWARDMIKMSPATDHIVWCNWKNLCCKSNRQLPSIDVEILLEQHLEWRDIERLKWRCWKLKCSLLYEADIYFTENKKYPKRWDKVESDCDVCWTALSFNIQTWTVLVKDENNNIFTIELASIKKIYQTKNQKEQSHTQA